MSSTTLTTKDGERLIATPRKKKNANEYFIKHYTNGEMYIKTYTFRRMII